MTSTDFEQIRNSRQGGGAGFFLSDVVVSAATGAFNAIRRWHKQRRDRAAFLTLLGKEDRIYRDLGIHRGDVEWASRLPKHINAAQELEKLRARNTTGR